MIYLYYTSNEKKLDENVFNEYLSGLPDYMRVKSKKYLKWEDAQAYLLGKFLLMKGLTDLGYPAELITKLQYDKYDKPFLNEPVSFNISHSGSCVLCVMSSEMLVGIDIEKIKPIQIQDFRDQFTAEEIASIESSVEREKSFFNYWTQKEAVIKADGRGLNIPLKEITVLENGAMIENTFWHLKKIELSDEYAVHLATNKKVYDINIIKVNY